ncbi:gas vesicle protein GvpU [Halalkalibacillus sediminis]|uniref:Gas vesicle protein GvpU n=1 Tax=Halalkalibacillus sediminis TaxID=2018042 RepID=A0A2I0QXW3_9BACI|nr:gas vesicle accessory protein GvpU [Halalkalibacillus sediminis]PKR79148.1 gas vesicle protein GvpU [Halalkalibacillus sediminis]
MNTTSNTKNDALLEQIINQVHSGELSVDVSLNVNGTLVTGTIISASEYLDTVAGYFSGKSDAEKKMKEKLSQGKEQLDNQRETEINFIHLKDANFFDEKGNALPSEGGVLWRGKLTQVDGYFLGKIKKGK